MIPHIELTEGLKCDLLHVFKQELGGLMLLIVQDFMALVPLRVIGHRMNQEREDWTIGPASLVSG